MRHRRLLPSPDAHRPFARTDMFERAGGRQAIDSLVDGLYDRIEHEPTLRRLFGRDLTNERAAQKRFFTEWLGGETAYTDRAHLPLAHRHDLLPITRALAAKWLACFSAALESAVKDEAARASLYAKTKDLAMALVNEGSTPSALRAKPHGTCLRYDPAVEALSLARRGDDRALRALIKRAPDVLASVPHAATLLQLAVSNGREPTVRLLLDSGVDANKPAPIAELIFVTPLCAARSRRRKAIEALLLERGAEEDVFTDAFLGDVERLTAVLARDPSLAQAVDPAVDALAITPIHHAVAGNRPRALQALLAPAGALLGAERALRDAVAHESVEMVVMLLERGAPATAIGAGRWVLHEELAPLLSAAGARVDRSGGWIGLSCTGNQGRKDDPDYVRALLRHGADVGDRRLVGQGTDGGRATALHYAAKAGFVKTIAVLLEHGANPDAIDDNGKTPMDWSSSAAKSVDKASVRRLLHSASSR